MSAVAFVSLTACSVDSLSPQSVFNDEETSATPLDEWLLTNYVKPYNINLQYRYLDMESDMVYMLVPAAYTQSWQLAKLVQFLCLESYDTITGSQEFIRSYFPKMIFLVGSPAYNNNGSIVLGTAEGGTKITLYNVNNLVPTNVSQLNSSYFKTIHHEFTHILNQTKPYSTDFDQITGTATGIEYVGNSCWTGYYTDAVAQTDGFISRYSSTVLQGAANGWRVALYPEATRIYGGYTVYAKFGKDQVTVTSENFSPDESDTSYYSISAWITATNPSPRMLSRCRISGATIMRRLLSSQ